MGTRRLDEYCTILSLVGFMVICTSCSAPSSYDLVTAKDATGRYTIKVTEKQFVAKNVTKLIVIDGMKEVSVQIDDDMIFGELVIAAVDEWILIVNDNYVVAGFNTKTGEIYGESQWKLLPFTQWSNSGTVLAKRRVNARGFLPTNYPLTPQKKYGAETRKGMIHSPATRNYDGW